MSTWRVEKVYPDCRGGCIKSHQITKSWWSCGQCGLVHGHVLVVVLSSKSATGCKSGLFSAIQCIFPKIPNKNIQKPPQQSHIFFHNDPHSDPQSDPRCANKPSQTKHGESGPLRLFLSCAAEGKPPGRSSMAQRKTWPTRGQHGRPGTPRHRRCRCPL